MEIKEDFILKSWLNIDPTKRPNIFEMTNVFYYTFFTETAPEDKKMQYLILLASDQNIPGAQFDLGLIYYK